MVMISAGVASLLASDSLRIVVLLKTVFGTGLLAAGASVLNQYFERDLDSRMRRTARRPLPAGELTACQALVFGVAVSVFGMLYVVLVLNLLTALLGLLTLICYLFVYTPLKTKSRLSTFVGAFPGAAPDPRRVLRSARVRAEARVWSCFSASDEHTRRAER